MMSWFSNVLQNREISRLEGLVEYAPAPSIFLRLSTLYSEHGEIEKAQELIRRGLELFPEDQAIIKAGRTASRAAHSEEKKLLKTKIEQYPNPTIYSKLANIFFEEGDLINCIRTCKNSLDKFPDYGGTYLILAKVSHQKNKFDEAIVNLEKAVELDRFNYMALTILAQQYQEKGESDKAKKRLQQILEFAPEDEKTLNLLQEFSGKFSAKTEESALSIAQSRPDEKTVGPEENKKHSTSTTGSIRLSQKTLKNLAATEGIEGCILMDTHGLVIGSELNVEIDEELTAALLTNIFLTSANCGEALLVGQFQTSILESDNGSIYSMDLQDMLLAVLATPEAKPGMINHAMQKFATKNI